MAAARAVGDARCALAGVLAVVVAGALTGCPTPPTALAKGQEAAQEFNQDARFGRNELLADRVAPSARDEFVAHHRSWGSAIRVADIELAGMRAKGDHELEVVVRVAWYRVAEEELRTTTVQQLWREQGSWQLTSEKRVDGDLGLLGETVVYQAPNDGPRTRFPTVKLGGGGDP